MSNGETTRVLIADDDELLCNLLEHKLASIGCQTISVGDGVEALAIALSEKLDLIVLDGMMPGMDGFEVLRRLRENEGTRKTPIVLLTARRMESDIVSGLELGADEYIVKPFMPEELLTRIRRLIGR